MAQRPLLVIDGDSLAHRAYHGSRPLAGAGGRPINALHGFAIMAMGLWRAEKPRAVLACWDTLTVPTYRHKEWPEYQTGREFDPEILEQLDRMSRCTLVRTAVSERPSSRPIALNAHRPSRWRISMMRRWASSSGGDEVRIPVLRCPSGAISEVDMFATREEQFGA